MKKLTLILAAIAAFVSCSAAAQAPKPQVTFCISPYEWCQLGCEILGPYVIDTFRTPEDATAFETNVLTALQRETVRRTTFQQVDRHVALLYRPVPNQVRPGDPGSDTCPITIRPRLRQFLSIDTATIELMHLPQDQRANASVFFVPPVPSANETALLVYLPPLNFNGDVDGTAAAKR